MVLVSQLLAFAFLSLSLHIKNKGAAYLPTFEIAGFAGKDFAGKDFAGTELC